MTEPFTIPNINIAGGPEIVWTFAGATARAELAGAKAYAEQRDDGGSDLRITVSLMNVGCALLWSHARWLEAQAVETGPATNP